MFRTPPRLAGLLAVIGLASLARSATPPPGDPVVDDFYGTKIEDRFRNLEQTSDPAVAGWMQAEGAATRALLDSMPGRAKLVERMREIEAGAPSRVFSVERLPGEKYRYLKRAANDNSLRLYRRDGPGADEKVVVDLQPWLDATGLNSLAFAFFASSTSGRRIAYGLSESGGEATTMRVLDVATGEDLIAPVDRTDLDSGESGDNGIGWLMDDSGFFFNRLLPQPQGSPPSERLKWSQSYLRRFGRPEDESRPLFGRGSRSGIALEASDVPMLFVPPDDRFVVALVIRGTQREFTAYVARRNDVIADRAKWRKLFGPESKITGMSMRGDALYLLTYDGAPRYRLLKTSFTRPDVAHAKTLYAPERGVLVSSASTQDALYLKVREGTTVRLVRIPHGSSRAEDVALPARGSFEVLSPDSRIPGVLIRLEGWDRGYQYYRYDPRSRRWANDGLQPAGLYDNPGALEVVETEARSHDGTMIPLSIVHREGMALDGGNPTILTGYGAYGNIDEASFEAISLAWLERGGVSATCHVRGGGIYGRAWYEAGKGATKPNTWKDAIACAEWLVAHGYASPKTLAIYGGSAGGILAGRAVTERPDLFVAAGIQNGALDMLRSERAAVGSQNVPEFGSTSTRAGFDNLFAMSTYHHVADGVRYPAMLFLHGVNDARVDVWHSLKTVARMREATAKLDSPNPIALRLDFDGGHGQGSTRDQHIQELADLWSFVLWRIGGDPAFSPGAPAPAMASHAAGR